MIQIKNKKRQGISGKNDHLGRHLTSVLTTGREIPKNKGENLDKMC